MERTKEECQELYHYGNHVVDAVFEKPHTQRAFAIAAKTGLYYVLLQALFNVIEDAFDRDIPEADAITRIEELSQASIEEGRHQAMQNALADMPVHGRTDH